MVNTYLQSKKTLTKQKKLKQTKKTQNQPQKKPHYFTYQLSGSSSGKHKAALLGKNNWRQGQQA